ncbi:MAG: PAS domain S-box protein [Desulfobacter sp.]|nr:MAG: PAS domain S-box protein [Desulfobacter sp.]
MFYVLFYVLVLLLVSVRPSLGKDARHVLLLNSYHKGYLWTDEITRGIEDGLKNENIELHVEYLDTKRQFDLVYRSILNRLLSWKHSQHHYDLVITSDNNAFDYFIEQGRQFFGDTPHIFCGLNYLNKQTLNGLEHTTGINEKADLKSNLSLIKYLHPHCDTVFVITDNTITGKIIQQEVKKLQPLFSKSIQIKLIYDVSFKELKTELNHMKSGAVGLYTFFSRDKYGKFMEFDEAAQLVADNSQVPIYGAWDFTLGSGIVGGYLVDGYQHGEAAAAQALKVLNGANISDVPVMWDTPVISLFDYNGLKKHNIPVHRLPSDSRVVNKPTSFYFRYKFMIWNVVSGFLFLILALIGTISGLIRAKRSEKKEQEGREHLQTTLNSIGDAVIATDINGYITQINPVAEHLTGWSRDQALGMPLGQVFKIIHAKTRLPAENPVLEVLETGDQAGRPNHMVLVSRTNDEYQISESAAPITSRNGGLQGVVLAFKDMTEEYALLNTLRKSELLHRNLFEKSSDAIFMVNRHSGICLDANHAAIELTERRLEELNQLAIRDIFTEIADKWAAPGIVSEQAVKLGEVRYSPPGGSDKRVRVSSVILDDDTMVGFAKDITKRKKAEEELIKSKEKFSKLFYHSPVWLLVSTVDKGRYIDVNDAFCRVTGYDREEVIGKTSIEFGLWENPEERRDIVALLNRDGQFDAHPVRFRMRDGTIRNFLWSAVVIDVDGENCALSTIIDITEIENTRKEKDRLAEQLHQAHKMEAIGTLAGGIAHDFNNILSGIFGYTQMALTHIGDREKACEDINEVLKGAHRAADLTRQILTFSRKTEYEKRPFKIYLEINEALKLLRSTIPSFIEIKKQLNSRSMVLADPVRIHQLIMNLCTNAYHAMAESGGILNISLTDVNVTEDKFIRGKRLPAAGYLKLEVSDSGVGMDKNTLKRAFDPYFTTKGVGQGTGLGLSIVKAIVEEHDAFLDIISAPSKGSTFFIYFPVVEKQEKNRAADTKSSTRLRGSETIMIVDDEEAIRNVCKANLEDYGYKVAVYENGDKALRAFKKDINSFDMVISDITMPVLTGDKLCQEILKIKPDLPVILFTGISQGAADSNAVKAGAKKLIQKPFDNTELIGFVREFLDKKTK